jgi:protein gp37
LRDFLIQKLAMREMGEYRVQLLLSRIAEEVFNLTLIEPHAKENNQMKCNIYNSTQHDYTFNFWRGCHKFAEECQNCYMYLSRLNALLGKDPNIVERTADSTWKQPITWNNNAKKAGEYKTVFSCSSSDFFIPDADAWRPDAWKLIRDTPSLIWQLTSKRTDFIADRLPPDWGEGYPNVWLGTSLGLKKNFGRLDTLRQIPCVLRWVGFSPTLEDLMPELAEHLDGFGWVNLAGETGCGRVEPRPFDFEWARKVRDLCKERGIPFFFGHLAIKERYAAPEVHHVIDGKSYSEVPLLPSGGGIQPEKPTAKHTVIKSAKRKPKKSIIHSTLSKKHPATKARKGQQSSQRKPVAKAKGQRHTDTVASKSNWRGWRRG